MNGRHGKVSPWQNSENAVEKNGSSLAQLPLLPSAPPGVVYLLFGRENTERTHTENTETEHGQNTQREHTERTHRENTHTEHTERTHKENTQREHTGSTQREHRENT